MELKYSKSNTPYIDLGNGMLIFSKITETSKGFKFMVFQGRQVSSVCVSGAKAKKKKYANISENINHTFDMDFKRDKSGKKLGIPEDARFCLTKITENILKKMFKDLVVDDEYFPRKNLQILEERLKSFYDKTDEWDDDPTATESYDDIGEKKLLSPGKKRGKKLKTVVKPKVKLKMKK